MNIVYPRKYYWLLLFILPLGSFSPIHAQVSASNFFLKHGNNLSQVTCGGIVFAPMQNQNHQAWGAGSVWLQKQIDLRQPVDISFILDYVDTTAVDGGAFVFTADSAAVGDSNNGLGYRNMKNSVAITFDAKQNSVDNDPAYDHISIQANGDTRHNTTNELTQPVSLDPFYTVGIFPSTAPRQTFHHLVTVKWDPATQTLSTFFDHNLIISAQYDLIQKVFNGSPIVYWGFTGSNTQDIWYPANKELTFGYFYFFFGDIFPRYTSNPDLDTCFSKPIQFFDASVYAVDSFYNNIQFAKWYWDFGDGQISNVRNPTPHQYPEAGEYTMKFTVSNHLGCTFDTLVRKIHLGSMPVVDFGVEGPVCENAPISFVDHTTSAFGPPTALTWNFDNVATSIEYNPQVIFPTSGSKNVTLHVRTYYGCESEKTKIIEVGSRPSIDFTYSTDCDGNVAFSPFIQNNTSITHWNWSFGDLSSSVQSKPQHHYKSNGQYESSLHVASNLGCISDTIQKSLIINKIYPFAGNDTILSFGEPLPLHATGGEFYQWIPATGLSNSGIADPVAVLNSDQTYMLIIRNSDGCEGRDTLNIKVYKGPELYLPNAFTPNSDGHNDYFRLVAPGIKTVDYFKVYNRSGILIFETKEIKIGWDGTFNGRPQPAATYIWMLSGTDYTGKKIFRKGVVVLIR